MTTTPVDFNIVLDITFRNKRREFPLKWVPVYDAERIKPPPDGTLRFTSKEILHIGRSQVIQGTLKSEEQTYPSDVVCKMASGDISRIQAEAEYYATVLCNGVQDILVPLFLDYFVGTSPYTGKKMACALFKYAGRALRGDWNGIPMEIRASALNSLLCLHRISVYHNNFSPRHVVVDNLGTARIIDFDRAETHECLVADRKFALYQIEPLHADLNCAEFYETSVEMDVWTPNYVNFMSISVDMRDIKSVEDLVKYARKCRPWTPLSVDGWIQKAHIFLKQYDDHYLRRRRLARARRKAAEKTAIAIPVSDASAAEMSPSTAGDQQPRTPGAIQGDSESAGPAI